MSSFPHSGSGFNGSGGPMKFFEPRHDREVTLRNALDLQKEATGAR